ncbi:hypothetical protein SAY87_026973 [Trapa incisa]|uniref:alanine--glyoxylate transaminase n=1 Tax=Trapa incisa TaxID=236973 RepID=A0AAN7GVC0_9MYRT|nr:hypothetical protein SAY87_026973 [Trapa incisa]
MLPWLVVPLIGFWGLSRFLPPAYRFEITSPRLGCVFVLLVTLFWYEILMPKLSAWRAHRNARLRERKRKEAIELQKLRKTATRKCRNCLTPYREQNPIGGKFMCSYCGHISKRPVLDLPMPPGMGISNAGIFSNLVGKGGKFLNGRAWSNYGWMCNQDWSENGNWAAGSFATKPDDWQNDGNVPLEGDEGCSAEKSYSSITFFAWKLLAYFVLGIRWLWRKIFSNSSSLQSGSFNDEHNERLTRGECASNSQESRSEKARRKAEEKRQARLEKELLEEEERKQREEVARLVEERRKLRDEITSTEKDTENAASPVRPNHSKKESEKRRHERKKDRDRSSSKSNSDVEELEKRVGKETNGKNDSDKMREADSREYQKNVIDSVKGQNSDVKRGLKSVSGCSTNRGSAGARYLDRMRGTLISSSKALSGTSFFGRTANTYTTGPKERRSKMAVNHTPTSVPKRDLSQPERIAGKSAADGVSLEPKAIPAPKKSWQQLFTRSTPVHPSTNSTVISRPDTKMTVEISSPPLPGQALSTQSFDRPTSFGLSSPFPDYPFKNDILSSRLGFSPAIGPKSSHLRGRSDENILEEPELFEDPCYVPDPVALLGPVSESLDSFQLDLGGFISNKGLEKPQIPKTLIVASEISRPLPIESPMSRLRMADDKHNYLNCLPGKPKSQARQDSPVGNGSLNDEKTWQMWGPSPLGQDGLGFIGGTPWHVNTDYGRLRKEEFICPSTEMTLASPLTKEDPALPDTYSPQKYSFGHCQNDGKFSTAAMSNDRDPWPQKGFFPSLIDNEKHISFKSQGLPAQNDIFLGTLAKPTSTHPLEPSLNNCWSNGQWAVPDTGKLLGNQSVGRPEMEGVLPPQLYGHFGTENAEAVRATKMQGRIAAAKRVLQSGLGRRSFSQAAAPLREAKLPRMPVFDYTPPPYSGPPAAEILAKRKEYLSPSIFHFYKNPINIVAGKKQYLFDENGRRYLDAFGGIATVCCGHCHPDVVSAIVEQTNRLQHSTVLYLNHAISDFAEALAAKMPGNLKVVFFTNSGTEANELAMMIAKLYTGCHDIISIRNSYHGNAAGTMGATAQCNWKFNVVQSGVHHALNPDPYRGVFGSDGEKYATDVQELIQFGTSGCVAGFISESIQGVGGIVELAPDYLPAVYKSIKQAGGLCIADEVQAGFARTGSHFWGFEAHGVVPDIVTMAKGIGNGIPLGAVVTTPEIAEVLTRRCYFNTFGGNPVCTSAGLAVLNVIEKEKLQENAHVVGSYLKDRLLNLKDKYDLVGDVRGRGLMLGLELVTDRSLKTPAKAEIVHVMEEMKGSFVLHSPPVSSDSDSLKVSSSTS